MVLSAPPGRRGLRVRRVGRVGVAPAWWARTPWWARSTRRPVGARGARPQRSQLLVARPQLEDEPVQHRVHLVHAVAPQPDVEPHLAGAVGVEPSLGQRLERAGRGGSDHRLSPAAQPAQDEGDDETRENDEDQHEEDDHDRIVPCLPLHRPDATSCCGGAPSRPGRRACWRSSTAPPTPSTTRACSWTTTWPSRRSSGPWPPAPTPSTSAASRPVRAPRSARPRSWPGGAVRRGDPRGPPAAHHQRRHLAGGRRRRGVRGRGGPGQRRLGRARPGGDGCRRQPGRGVHLRPHRRPPATDRPAPGALPGRRRPGRGDLLGQVEAALRRRGPRGRPADRRGPGLRQEHLPLAGADRAGLGAGGAPAGRCCSRSPTRSSSPRRSA